MHNHFLFFFQEIQIVDIILSMWKPWLVPLHQSKLTHKPPDWVLQLTLDGPLLPCSADDGAEISKMMSTFMDCASNLNIYTKGKILYEHN